MGRSKFPGKPTKLVNKKRISVLSTSPTSSASSQTSENLSVNTIDDDFDTNDSSSSASESATSSAAHSPLINSNESGLNNSLWNTNQSLSSSIKGIPTNNHQNSGLLATTSIQPTSSSSSATSSSKNLSRSAESANLQSSLFSNDGDDNIQKMITPSSEQPPPSKPPDDGRTRSSNNPSDHVDSGNSISSNKKQNSNAGVQTRARSNPTTCSTNNSNTNITATTNISSGTNITTVLPTNNSVNSKDEKKVKQKKTVTFKSVPETSDDVTVKKVYNPDNAPLVPIIKKECLTRSSVRIKTECLVRPSRLTEILKNNENNIDKLNSITFRTSSSSVSSSYPVPSSTATAASSSSHSSNSKSNLDAVILGGDKRFVLPKRSAHSCRVIKPNKRFLDGLDDVFNKKHLRKNNIANRKISSLSIEDNENYDENGDDDNNDNGGNNKYENEDYDDESEASTKFHSDDEQSDDSMQGHNDNIADEPKSATTSSPSTPIAGGSGSKCILRQPKLTFNTSSTLGSSNNADGPFSFSITTNTTLGSLTSQLSACRICGAQSSAFGLDQNTRKFGIISCEACRKFMSKMIKKLALHNSQSASSTDSHHLECKKGDGSCSIVPMMRGNNLKSLRRILKERCHACWLKKSVLTFQVPSGLKSRLTATLPTEMRQEIESAVTCATATSSISPLPSPFSIKKEINSDCGNIFSPSAQSGGRLLSWPQDCMEMDFKTSKILSISNPLSENNTTFGSSPMMIKPTISDKTIFKKGEGMAENKAEVGKKVMTTTGAKNSVIDEKIAVAPEETSRIKTRKKEPPTSSSSSIPSPTNNPVIGEQTKRQRIDLKGPRVKHVCRSASIVLGQPVATFGVDSMESSPRAESPKTTAAESTAVDSVVPMEIANIKTENPSCDDRVITPSPPPLAPVSIPIATPLEETQQNEEESADNRIVSDVVKTQKTLEDISKPLTRKVTRPGLVSSLQSATNLSNRNATINAMIKKLPEPPPPLVISIDFWENYDPAEVSQTGFGLIVTEDVPLRALCFLCGSSGLDPMIFCVCCCEPYHQYCVEDEYNLRQSSLDETMTSMFDASITNQSISPLQNRLNWLCPRCTVCYTCNMSSGSKIKCQKCQKNYHSTCLGTSKRLLGADRPLICANCLKCKSCGTTNVNKFVGNLPMCHACFKLRQRGNYCPLCQKCYEDNDFDLKMMECGECQRWVHAKCEGVPDEQYNMLSALPENIEFICKKCSKSNANAGVWREAVLNEFKTGLLSVIKLLSKSRQACALLKISPRKKSVNCMCHPISANRILQFENSSCSPEQDASVPDVETKCFCSSQKINYDNNIPNLFDVKRKINANEYYSVQDFNYDMQIIVNGADCDDLQTTYKEILSETFPWFQNETKACTDALVEDMYDSNRYDSPTLIETDQQVPMINVPDDIDDYFYATSNIEETRICMFCKVTGEGMSSHEARLLYCGHNNWAHTNCALWSAEVFEEIDGSLQNVHSAISRGRLIKCVQCGNKGATVGCNAKGCYDQYHYPCARSTDCIFLMDKTVYCPQHRIDAQKKNIAEEKNFDILRPVYVELDRRKKKLMEPTKIQFLIGSLYVKKLGRFVTSHSDTCEAIVPADYQCTRLYWSTKEPWKIVEYTVKTSIHNNNINASSDAGRNFTVDHSKNMNLVQLELSQINKWHLSLANGEDFEFTKLPEGQEGTSSGAGPGDEEPQNNADLLPPEIKDVIFEDLPHDLLDGISMLDILPKLMTYEDLVAMDMKNEAYLCGDLLKEGKEELSDDDLDNGNSEWGNATYIEDALLSSNRPPAGSNRELKRSKSEVFPRGAAGSRSHQRSCSLTWSCKLDSNSVVKRRKVSVFQEYLSLGGRTNEMKYPTAAAAAAAATSSVCERRLSLQNDESRNVGNRSLTWTATKKLIPSSDSMADNVSEGTMLERLKIAQLDGGDDLMYESVTISTNFGIANPVKCDRCHCTYRTHESYQRHLQTCEPMSASESESELTPRSSDVESPLQQHQHQQNLISTVTSSMAQEYNFATSALPYITSQGTTTTTSNPQNIFMPQNLQIPSITSLPNISGSNMIFTASPQTQNHQQQQLFTTQSMPVFQNMNQFNTQQPQIIQTGGGMPQTITLPNNLNFNQQIMQQQPQQQNQIIQITTSTGPQLVSIAASPQQQSHVQLQQPKLLSPNKNQLILPQPEKTPTKRQTNRVQTMSGGGRGKGRQSNQQKQLQAAQMKQQQQMRQIRPEPPKLQQQHQQQQQQQQQIQMINQNLPMIRPNNPTQNMVFQNPTTNQPIIVQQNPIQYVTDGHNTMQYITQQPQSQQYLTPSTYVPGTFQLQTDTSGNLVLANTPSGISMLPMAQTQQPQVIGTLLQPQATTIQCGMMATEQMMLGSTPTLEMVQDPTSGCMYLTSQPVYYGLETIVRNTVMSSQQFVSTAMQGVLSQNSSFQNISTTTQVFQASKIEPIMEVPSGYVVLNNDVNLNMLPQANTAPQPQTVNVLQTQPSYQQLIQPQNTPQLIQTPTIIPTVPVEPKPAIILPKETNFQSQQQQQQRTIPVVSASAQMNTNVPIQRTNIKPTSKSVTVKPKMIGKPVVNKATPIKPSSQTTSQTTPTKISQQQIIVPLNIQQQQQQQQLQHQIQQQQQANFQLQQKQQQQQHTQQMEIKSSPAKKIEIIDQQILEIGNEHTMEQTQQHIQPHLQQQPILSTINLPTAPYAPPPHLSGIPTNIVNPIPQNTNTNVSRPTNRVLPMQTLQHKHSPPTPPETKISLMDSSNEKLFNQEQHYQYSHHEMPEFPVIKEQERIEVQILSPPPQQPSILILASPETHEIQKVNKHQSDEMNNIQDEYNKQDDVPLKTEDLFKPIESSPLYMAETSIHNLSSDSENLMLIDEDPEVETKRDENDAAADEDDDDDDEDDDDDDDDKDDDSEDRDDNMGVKEKISQILVNLENDEAENQQDLFLTKVEADASLSTPEKQVPSPMPSHYQSPHAIITSPDHLPPQDVMASSSDQKENINPEESSLSLQCNEFLKFQQKLSALQQSPLKTQPQPQKPTGPHMLYEIQSQDGFTYKSTSITEVWDKVFEAVQLARKNHGLTPLPEGPLGEMSGPQMLGLKTNALKYLLEQLPGVEKCGKYQPKYHKREINNTLLGGGNQNSVTDYASDIEDLKENPFGTARSEPYSTRSSYDMFSWLASRHRKQPALIVVQTDMEIIPRRGSGSNLPMAMRYRTLKETSKESVGVYRSHIHGRGLFCIRDIEAGEMVIEYAGELIRSTLTDKREKYYDSKGIGCYMFKIDDNLVVDATMRGNAARFINHACEPNCYSKVVDILGHKHIIIFALRRIVQGEELTYDYKFPFEDEKIPCSCGSKRCRKYLN